MDTVRAFLKSAGKTSGDKRVAILETYFKLQFIPKQNISPSGRPRVSFYVHVDVNRLVLDLHEFCSDVAQNHAITVSIAGHKTTIVTAYIWTNTN